MKARKRLKNEIPPNLKRLKADENENIMEGLQINKNDEVVI